MAAMIRTITPSSIPEIDSPMAVSLLIAIMVIS
jgi:hypothetical protein